MTIILHLAVALIIVAVSLLIHFPLFLIVAPIYLIVLAIGRSGRRHAGRPAPTSV